VQAAACLLSCTDEMYGADCIFCTSTCGYDCVLLITVGSYWSRKKKFVLICSCIACTAVCSVDWIYRGVFLRRNASLNLGLEWNVAKQSSFAGLFFSVPYYQVLLRLMKERVFRTNDPEQQKQR
jgi:hypothetical protein